jgi:hypothetical protein
MTYCPSPSFSFNSLFALIENLFFRVGLELFILLCGTEQILSSSPQAEHPSTLSENAEERRRPIIEFEGTCLVTLQGQKK